MLDGRIVRDNFFVMRLWLKPLPWPFTAFVRMDEAPSRRAGMVVFAGGMDSGLYAPCRPGMTAERI
jgi:hypothetical protein